MARGKKKEEETADRAQVPLSEKEIDAAGRELATVGIERRGVEQEAKDAAAGFRAKLKPIKKRQRELEDQIATGMRCEEAQQSHPALQ